MNKDYTQSRRRLLTTGSLAAGGIWMLAGGSFFPRLIRGVITERHRPITPRPFRPSPMSWSDSDVTASWLGHSTVLINFYGLTILTDPALFSKVGAKVGSATVGRKRLIEPALYVPELPPIDLVLVSHAHMDHLDLPTLRALPKHSTVVTAKGTTDLILRAEFSEISELHWGQKMEINSPLHGSISVEAFQVRHWGARWGSDRFRRYNGYLLEREGKKILFGGDTAMCSHFAALKSKGPFDLAIMPIGAYRKGNLHCTPAEAVKMANQAGCDYFMPIHHKTFSLGPEPAEEPLHLLSQVIDQERIALTDVGQTFSISA